MPVSQLNALHQLNLIVLLQPRPVTGTLTGSNPQPGTPERTRSQRKALGTGSEHGTKKAAGGDRSRALPGYTGKQHREMKEPGCARM